MVLISQRQSYVFTLLTRPESIVSHIGFHLADVTIAHLHDETLCYIGKENLKENSNVCREYDFYFIS